MQYRICDKASAVIGKLMATSDQDSTVADNGASARNGNGATAPDRPRGA